MYYTLADLREIVAYAAARNIEIMPEIDMPGHMVAALAAYPELSCLPKQQYKVRITPGISHDVLNVGDDKVIDFLKTVLGTWPKCSPASTSTSAVTNVPPTAGRTTAPLPSAHQGRKAFGCGRTPTLVGRTPRRVPANEV